MEEDSLISELSMTPFKSVVLFIFNLNPVFKNCLAYAKGNKER